MPKPKPLERSLQATATRKFKALRAQDPTFAFRKRHGSTLGLAGDPDFYGLWRGLHWELELKAPGAKPTKLQDERRGPTRSSTATSIRVGFVRLAKAVRSASSSASWRSTAAP